MAMSKSELAKFSHYSDEELEAIANQDKKSAKSINLADYAHMSNEELEAIANQNKNAPGNLVATDTQPWSLSNILSQFGKGFGQGAVDTGTALVNLPKRGVDAAFGKEPDPFTYDIPGQEPHSIPNLLGKGAELGAELLVAPEVKAFQALAAKLAPIFLKAAPGAKEAINSSKLAQLVNYAPAAADVGATGAAYGALFGANNPEQTLRESALKGALGSMAIGGAARIPSAFREMDVRQLAQKIKSGKERGRSPAETAKYMEDIQGLPIDIGTAVDNESRFQKYKDLGSFPGSGVKQNAAEINAIVSEQANKLKKDLSQDADILGTNDLALNILEKDYDKQKKLVSKLFNATNREANKYGVRIDRKNTDAVINNIIGSHERAKKIGTTPMFGDKFINSLREKLSDNYNLPKISQPSFAKKLFKEENEIEYQLNPATLQRELKYTDLPKTIVTFNPSKKGVREIDPLTLNEIKPGLYLPKSSGKYSQEKLGYELDPVSMLPIPKEKPTFHDIDEERKVFNEKSEKHARDYNRSKSGVFKALQEASIKDIEEAINKTGKPELISQWKNARKIHKTDVIKYRKKDIEDYILGKKSSENIHNILVKPEKQNLFNVLPESIKKRIVYKYFNPSGKEITDSELANKYKSLNANAKERLLGQAAKEWDTLVKLNEIKQKINPILEKPDTGFKNLPILQLLKAVIAGGLAAHAGGINSTTGSISTIGGLLGLNRLKTKYATSPKTLQAYIEQSSAPSESTKEISKLARMLYSENQNR